MMEGVIDGPLVVLVPDYEVCDADGRQLREGDAGEDDPAEHAEEAEVGADQPDRERRAVALAEEHEGVEELAEVAHGSLLASEPEGTSASSPLPPGITARWSPNAPTSTGIP